VMMVEHVADMREFENAELFYSGTTWEGYI
jgi:hypothetical protein